MFSQFVSLQDIKLANVVIIFEQKQGVLCQWSFKCVLEQYTFDELISVLFFYFFFILRLVYCASIWRGCHWTVFLAIPDRKVRGVNMGPIWGRQDPGGPHVGPMNFAIWDDKAVAVMVFWLHCTVMCWCITEKAFERGNAIILCTQMWWDSAMIKFAFCVWGNCYIQ